jgi:hypothetical protein
MFLIACSILLAWICAIRFQRQNGGRLCGAFRRSPFGSVFCCSWVTSSSSRVVSWPLRPQFSENRFRLQDERPIGRLGLIGRRHALGHAAEEGNATPAQFVFLSSGQQKLRFRTVETLLACLIV